MKILKVLFMVIVLFLAKPIAISAQAVDEKDSLALVDLYNSTNGPHWTVHTNWLKGPVRTWVYVNLTEDGTRVKDLYPSASNLTGEIPQSLGNLSYCEYLNLSSNNLIGEIPVALGNLKRIQRIDLFGNQLKGEIPASLGYLPDLWSLSLGTNHLTGIIPESIGRMQNFYYLGIQYNKFTFNGMESVVQRNIKDLSYYQQDTILPLKRKGDTLYVSAGGSLQNNTYLWMHNGATDTTIIGDSTYLPKKSGKYKVFVYNSIVTGFNLYSTELFASPINFIDPNPTMITANGSIDPNMGTSDYNIITTAATDGVTKVLLAASSGYIAGPITFTITHGKGSLSTLSNQSVRSQQVTLEQDQSGTVMAIYTVPDGYGKDNEANKEVRFSASNNTGVIGHGVLQLVKPPVILVHGMWSDPDVWDKGGFLKALRKSDFSNVFLADYSAFSATTFNPESQASLPGRNSISAAVKTALFSYRSNGIAVTQADIVGHSLGGMMSRSWSQQNDFKGIENYQKGYIHKLITLNTPHRGSPLGPELVASQYNLINLTPPEIGFENNLTVPIPLGALMALIGMPVGSCHADFGVTSPGISAIKATPPYHTYAVVGDQTGQIPGFLAFLYFSLAALNHNYFEIFKAHDPCTNILDHDLIVPTGSQRGYINSYKTFYATGHSAPAFTTVTNSKEVQAKVINLLLSDSLSEFSTGFPAPSAFPLDCTTANQRTSTQAPRQSLNRNSSPSSANKGVRITSPGSGVVYNKDSSTNIKFQYEKVGEAKPSKAIFLVEGVGWFPVTDSLTNSVTVTLPGDASIGKLNVILLARDSSGLILGDTLHITILPDGILDSIAVNPGLINLDSSIRQSSVLVSGFYKNSQGNIISNNISHSSTGTVYEAGPDSIFTVTPDGLVSAIKPGVDTLLVKNGSFSIEVRVVVNDNYALKSLYPNAIIFDEIADKYVGDSPFVLTASSLSGENVDYTLIEGPVMLSNGVVVLKDTAGTVTIKASVRKSAYFDSAISVVRTFRVLPLNPLAVSNLVLEGNKENNANVLSWSTLTEKNNTGFNVERSLNGREFSGLTFVPSKSLNYFSYGKLSYKFEDTYPPQTAYYRLRQIDLDGQSSYSNTIAIRRKKSLEVSTYPNPASKEIVVSGNKRLTSLQIIDMSGRILKRLSPSATSRYSLSGIAGGVYFLRVWCDDESEQVKIVITGQ